MAIQYAAAPEQPREISNDLPPKPETLNAPSHRVANVDGEGPVAGDPVDSTRRLANVLNSDVSDGERDRDRD